MKKREARRSACLSRLVLVAVLALAPLPGSSEEGVAAELRFLDGAAAKGELFQGHIRVELSPDARRPLPMLLDTGAQGTVMTPRYARALHVNVRKIKEEPYRKRTVFGRDLLFNVDTRSSETASRTGWEFGLLGWDFLRDYVLDIDYRRGSVRFLDPAIHPVTEETGEPGELVLPMGLTDGRPTVEIMLGRGSLQFIMDTGAPGGLIVSEEKARELGIEIPEDARLVEGQGVIGRDVKASFIFPSVLIGGRRVRNVVLAVALREGSAFRITNLAGQDEALLGNRFLSRFRVRIDYAHSTVGLLPQVQPPVPEDAVASLPPGTFDTREETADRSADPGTAARELQPVFVPIDLSPARQARSFDQEVWVQLDAADALALSGPVAYVDIAGWAGAGQQIEHDVMIVVDTSGSTALASGSDIDGDGKVGRRSKRRREYWRNFNPAYLSSDLGDTILAAEALATQRLVRRIGTARTRIGLLSFSNHARVEAPLGSDERRMHKALGKLDAALGAGGTNLAAAVSIATDALVLARPPTDSARRQSMLILSDGYPTLPQNRAEDEAFDRAREAAKLGIHIYTFALGLHELKPDDVFVEMALMSGGSHERLPDPAEVVYALSRVNLTEVTRIEIANLSTGESARAPRVFPDGSFDGIVRLRAGQNRVRVSAFGDAGGSASVERLVTYTPAEPRDAEEARRFADEVERFRKKLKMRTLETLLATRAMSAEEAEREASRRLTLEVED